MFRDFRAFGVYRVPLKGSIGLLWFRGNVVISGGYK